MSIANLYLLFLAIGLTLFACIYIYSKIQLNRKRKEFNRHLPDSGNLNTHQTSSVASAQSEVSGVQASDKNVSIGGVTATVSADKEAQETVDQSFNENSYVSPYKDDDFAPEVDSAPLEQLAEELAQSTQDLNSEDDQYASDEYSQQRIVESSLSEKVIDKDDAIEKRQNELFPEQTESTSRSVGSHEADKQIKSVDQQVESASTNTGESTPKQSSRDAFEIVASIQGGAPVSRDDVLSLYRTFDYLFTRKVGIFGKNSLTAVWEDVEQSDASVDFLDIAVAIQLADKTGAMTRKESNTFSTMAIELADQLNRKIVFSMDLDEAIERGRELDEVARRYDAMVVCNIIPKRKQGFSSIDIKSCTRDLNMVQSSNGVLIRFSNVANEARLRYSLAVADDSGKYVSVTKGNSFHVKNIILFVKVPLVSEPTNAFDLMMNDAYRLAAWLDGKVVDKHGRNMTARTKDALLEQIVLIEQQMASEGLVPGSELCRKLF